MTQALFERPLSSRTRFYLASGTGGLAATIVYAWVVLLGRADLFGREALAEIYDAQARGLLHGTWEVSPDALSFERFNIDGHYYTYFGPWPALLRLPVVAFTDSFDGRLSRFSMLLGFAVFLTFVSRLAWQTRVLMRGEGPLSRATLAAASGFVFVAGCGSTALFLASRAWVYHEALLWGIAWSVASFSLLISYLLRPRPQTLMCVAATATLALLSRPSLGAGPELALGVLLVAHVVPQRLTQWVGIPGTATRRPAWPVVLSVLVPVALYATINYQKFGSLFGVPLGKQDLIATRPDRVAAFAAHPSSFSFAYAPTNLLQYLRPDGIRFDRLFPWVTFATPAHIVGDAPFENIEPSASITITSLLLVALAVVGVVAAIRARRIARDAPSPAVLRLPLLASGVSASAIMVFWAQFHRYEGDALPFLVIGAAAGLFWMPALLADRGTIFRVGVAAAMVVLAAWSVWATFGLTLLYQRSYSAFQATSVRAGFVGFQLDVEDRVGFGGPGDVQQGAALPSPADEEFRVNDSPPLGQFFIVGDCEGLYVSSRRGWEPIEVRPPGRQRWRVTFAPQRPGTRVPLWSAGTDAETSVVWAERVGDDRVRIDFEVTGTMKERVEGQELLRVEPGVTYDLDVRLDPSEHYVEVSYGDTILLMGFPRAFNVAEPSRMGRQPDPALGAKSFSDSIERLSATPICDRIVDEIPGDE